MTPETIAIAADHGGFPLKEKIVRDLAGRGLNVLDLGTDSADSVDYPEFAGRMVSALKTGKASRGVLVCGSGIGISIAANRHSGIRAALCYNPESAELARRHNDANVLCLGARTMPEDLALEMLGIFLATDFDGGRHARRVEQLG